MCCGCHRPAIAGSEAPHHAPSRPTTPSEGFQGLRPWREFKGRALWWGFRGKAPDPFYACRSPSAPHRPRPALRGLGGGAWFCDPDRMAQGPDIVYLARMLGDARRIVLFTGAGISTGVGHSRLSQPRRPLDQADADRLLRFHALGESAPGDLAAALRDGADPACGAAQSRPSRGGAIDPRRQRVSVITQNIDGLHQESGIPPAQVIELHGNTTYAHCLTCGSATRSTSCGSISSATASCRTVPAAAM